MKFSLAVLLVLLAQPAQAFSPMHGSIKGQQLLRLRTSTTTTTTGNSRRHSPLLLVVLAASPSSSAEEKVAALRAAAAKAREDVDRLSRELGKTPTSSSSKATAESSSEQPKKSLDEIKAMLPALLNESDVNKQVQQWQALKASSSINKFGQANLASFAVSLAMLEQRTSLTPETLGLDDSKVDLDEFKYATLYVVGGSTVAGIASLALLPENVGATLCYLFALIPILFIGIGSTSPVIIANAIAAIKGNNKDKDGNASVSLQERICRHEAAHFCCGYWCGLPVAQYSVQENLARVEFGCVPEPGVRGLSQKQVAGLAVTALAGTVGEALQWNNAEGAKNDLLQLDSVFKQSAEFIGAAKQQDLTRWGALTAAMLLKNNNESYERVVQAFARQASVEECIAILES